MVRQITEAAFSTPSPVYAISKTGKRFRTETDEQGIYTFTVLPSGKYQVKADLPPGLSLRRYGGNHAKFSVEIKAQGAGCQISMFPQLKTQ